MQEKCLTGERTAEADENGEMVGNVRKICGLSLPVSIIKSSSLFVYQFK